MKKSILIISISVALILIASTLYFTVSFYKTHYGPETLTLDKAIVTCEIEKIVNLNKVASIKIKNTSNTEAFLRITLAVTLEDDEGEACGRSTSYPQINITSDWIKDPYSYTYYCKNPVLPGGTSPELISSVISLSDVQIEDIHCVQILEMAAEAIQSRPDYAVEESWPVLINNHTITAVERN